MLKRDVLSRRVVFVLCAGFVFAAAVLPGGVRAAMSDEEFVALCREGTAEQIQQALKDGANLHAETAVPGRTPLTEAAREGNLAAVGKPMPMTLGTSSSRLNGTPPLASACWKAARSGPPRSGSVERRICPFFHIFHAEKPAAFRESQYILAFTDAGDKIFLPDSP